MAGGINPFALQMQQLQRRQALADQMLQQSQQPLDTQFTGGPSSVAVRRSPFEGIAKLAQAATGAYVQNKNDQTYQDLAAQMMAGQRSALSGLSGGGGQPAAPADPNASSNMPPESIRAPGYQPPALPPASPTAQAPNSFANTLDAAQNASNYGVDPEVIKAAIADQARTDQMKNDSATGIAPGERGNLVRRDSIKQAFVPGSGGMLDIDASGQPVFRQLPGLAESTANATGLNTAATQANTPHYEPDPFHPGQFRTTYATPPAMASNSPPPLGSVGRGGPMPGPTQPQQQPGAPPPGLPPPGTPASTLPAPGAPALTPPAAGGTAADLEGQKLGAKTGQDYAAEITAKAASALDGQRTLAEMANLRQGFTPGVAAPFLAKMGSVAQAFGVDPATVQKWTGVNPGNAEAFQKGTAALASEAAKQMTNKVTQTDFLIYLKNNPNWMMTPQGMEHVTDFMGKGFDQQIQAQQQFAKWSKNVSPDRWAIDFPAAYNQQQAAAIKAGKTNSTTPTMPSTTPPTPASSFEGRTATGPNGQKLILKGGQWVPNG